MMTTCGTGSSPASAGIGHQKDFARRLRTFDRPDLERLLALAVEALMASARRADCRSSASKGVTPKRRTNVADANDVYDEQ
jgi:hypothetical protein